MPSITYRVTGVCPGGNHYTLQLSGDITKTIVIDQEDLQKAEDLSPEVFALALLKYFARGRTTNQIRTALQNGVTITVGT